MSNVEEQFDLTHQQLAIKLAHLTLEELQDVFNQANRKLQQDGKDVVLGMKHNGKTLKPGTMLPLTSTIDLVLGNGNR